MDFWFLRFSKYLVCQILCGPTVTTTSDSCNVLMLTTAAKVFFFSPSSQQIPWWQDFPSWVSSVSGERQALGTPGRGPQSDSLVGIKLFNRLQIPLLNSSWLVNGFHRYCDQGAGDVTATGDLGREGWLEREKVRNATELLIQIVFSNKHFLDYCNSLTFFQNSKKGYIGGFCQSFHFLSKWHSVLLWILMLPLQYRNASVAMTLNNPQSIVFFTTHHFWA